MRSSVLLPQPLGPTTDTKLPLAMVQSMFFSASTPPAPGAPKVLERPRISMWLMACPR
jgi:hypothetical protein